MLREVAILIQVKESKYDNYSPKLLRVLYVLNTKVFVERLRKAFIANILINLFRNSNKNFKVNRLIEFLNRLVSISKRDRLSSTKLLDELLG